VPQHARDNPQKWPDTVTSQEVVNFALQRMAYYTAKFAVGCTAHDGPAMVEAVKGIRSISTRMDQYRRTQERRWQSGKQQAQTRGRLPESS
jgi:hypothetical protein